ncbi:MAG TPA: universal stress protein [Chitinophagaceae bacterium]|nr:universal stress protein [Chitinophagaceae bacterium]
MKKIVAAFDGLKFSESTGQYAIQIAQLSNARLVGLFLEDIAYHSYKIYDLVTEEGGFSPARKRKMDEKDAKKRAASIEKFEVSCKKAGVQYILHRDRNIAIQELLHESIYADLVIINGNETLSHYPEKAPTRFIRDLLNDVQCPVLIIPDEFIPIDKLVLLYDGEPSSVFAIKMFSYIMAPYREKPVKILTVRNPDQPSQVPDNKLMKEFVKSHFPGASFLVMKGWAEKEIVNYLKSLEQGSLVVLGAYRRGRVSRWFRASMADTLMTSLRLPLFIAHNK